MNAEQYARISDPFRRYPKLLSALCKADKLLTTLFYVLYPLLIVILLVTSAPEESPLPFNPLLLPCVLVPFAGFVVISVLRKAINAPRPYEALSIDPLIHKDTKGQSLPSKHTFSSFAIAFCWLRFCAPAGAILLALACCIGAVRVIGGVHFPRDVFAAAALGCLCGIALFAW